ncbi:MAG: hypothetical protein LJE84_01920 [Gammaproteobacteria bacterium]|nr:hypothetical protein [Gammaproteobacteria bacterium]
MKSLVRIATLFWLAVVVTPPAGAADGVLMARSQLSFWPAMEAARAELAEYGYKVAHVQRCDGGMRGMGYKTDFYRILFFGKLEEVRHLSEKYPQMIPYLPLKLAVIAEGEQTLFAILNLEQLQALFPEREIQLQLRRWYSDVQEVLETLRKLEPVPGAEKTSGEKAS